MIDLRLLNDEQKKAVLTEDKYIRIVAGAGSGKTRVLTMRVAHLINDLGVNPNNVLAITFTNKAANEMKERLRDMLDQDSAQPWISTIHSFCVRILREDIQCMGWPRNFTVLDAEDQKTILKEAYKILGIDATTYPYAYLLDYIANNKCAEISVERAFLLAGSFTGDKTKAKVYEYYVNRQNELYALDFDDLILWTVRMFKTYSEVLTKWQKRYKYIHVDEFQDIDKIQYELIKQLTGIDNSLYVVGDPDQTIYTWRGADVNIILNFDKDFPKTKTIVLNENYRSTTAILNGANSVIRNNHDRLEKELFTNRKSDEKITHYASASDAYQAAWIAAKIKQLHKEGKPLHDMAILYRSNYLSRALEKGLLDERIPYVIYGGVRFYERAEVKDALSYLRMVTSSDDLALQRILNKPKRGIGNKTMDTIATKARAESTSMYNVIKEEKLFSGKVQKTLDEFVKMIENWKHKLIDEKIEIDKLFETILDESGLIAMYEEDNEVDRIENIKELIDDIVEFTVNYPDSSLDEYLQMVSLYGDRDETLSADYIQLMTVHAAKGLEFDTVFVSDMNDGIFPNERAMTEGKKGVEEERRLAYVAFTRAKNKLYLTEAGGFSYILQKARSTSRFIEEIDDEYIEHIGAVHANNPYETTPLHSILFDNDDEGIDYEKQLDRIVKPQFSKGDVVVHEKFGEGIVLKCDGNIAEIAFAYPHGVKKMLAGHPSLKKKSELN